VSREGRKTPLSFGINPRAIEDAPAAYDPRRQYGVSKDDSVSNLTSKQTTQTFDNKGQPKDMDRD